MAILYYNAMLSSAIHRAADKALSGQWAIIHENMFTISRVAHIRKFLIAKELFEHN